jgi:hypothetical protein
LISPKGYVKEVACNPSAQSISTSNNNNIGMELQGKYYGLPREDVMNPAGFGCFDPDFVSEGIF